MGGKRPTLRLLTRDGAMLDDSDPVGLLAGQDQISAAVVLWAMPPPGEHYRAACASLRAVPDADVEAALAGEAVALGDMALGAAKAGAVFAAMRRENVVTRLELSGNMLGDDGVKVSARRLGTILQLC